MLFLVGGLISCSERSRTLATVVAIVGSRLFLCSNVDSKMIRWARQPTTQTKNDILLFRYLGKEITRSHEKRYKLYSLFRQFLLQFRSLPIHLYSFQSRQPYNHDGRVSRTKSTPIPSNRCTKFRAYVVLWFRFPDFLFYFHVSILVVSQK